MNGKKAKMARRLAREELAHDPTPLLERELVVTRVHGHDRVINDPFTVRTFTQKIKQQYKASAKRGHQAA